jgi:hypothetical protein
LRGSRSTFGCRGDQYWPLLSALLIHARDQHIIKEHVHILGTQRCSPLSLFKTTIKVEDERCLSSLEQRKKQEDSVDKQAKLKQEIGEEHDTNNRVKGRVGFSHPPPHSPPLKRSAWKSGSSISSSGTGKQRL